MPVLTFYIRKYLPMIVADCVEYNSEDLSYRGKANLSSLSYFSGKITELEAEIEIYETAIGTYIMAMKSELEATKS